MAPSTEQSPPDEAMEQHIQETDGPPNHKYKSFKKKYNKMRHAFKEKMNMSNALFAEEQKAIKVTRRLQEQNDQLLDLLLQANESTRVPPHLHYDLRSPTPSESAVPTLEPDTSTQQPHSRSSALATLEEAKHELSSGQITPGTYAQLETALRPTLHKPISLSQLSSSTLHTALQDLPEEYIPQDIAEPSPAGYLTLEHEEEYLSALDATLEGAPRVPAADSHPIRSNEREKEVQLRNPVSVYNWLRKHQPQVFLQDSDSSPDKPAAKAASSSKPSRRSAAAPKTEEVFDDDGVLLGVVEGPTRSKRKREDEPYRPKGGSSRPAKKKKGVGEKGREGGDEEGL